MVTQHFLTKGFVVLAGAWVAADGLLAEDPKVMREALRVSLTFHAGFDGDTDAAVARGDARLFTAAAAATVKESRPGLHTGEKTRLAKGAGKYGDALEFTAREAPFLFYRAEKNVVYRKEDWSGTASFWLRLDPEEDLEPGYCDPIQITTRAWNDAAFFVDFDQAGDPRDFRLGAFPDLSVWNPENAEVPEEKRPLLKVRNPPFGRDRWTHVAFTWEDFNKGNREGRATFYLDGKNQGQITGWEQTFRWREEEEVRLYAGLYYIGLFDELSCFDRALTEEEISFLHGLEGGIAALSK
ncbi:MAG TPA: LamG-like jellyroll fold domain-containing protein [Verrucomicrobiales bacterium]|nr:LamG-like jellyroll fold domain-containing protein [Verrucomicrobiales bacterium]